MCSTPEPAQANGRIVANGGRVLNVAARGDDARRSARPRLCGDRARGLPQASSAATSAGALSGSNKMSGGSEGQTPKKAAGDMQRDGRRLEDFLARHVPGFAEPATATRFRGGQSNPTYLIATPTHKYVLRAQAARKLLPSAHAIEREYAVMTALASIGFPVPRTYALCADEDDPGHPVLRHGSHRRPPFSGTPGCPSSAADERAAVYSSMNAALARLHTRRPTAPSAFPISAKEGD